MAVFFKLALGVMFFAVAGADTIEQIGSMKVVKTHFVDKSDIREDGVYDFYYEGDIYKFYFSNFYYQARSYIDEPEKVSFLGKYSDGKAFRLTDDEMKSEAFASAVKYLKKAGFSKIEYLDEDYKPIHKTFGVNIPKIYSKITQSYLTKKYKNISQEFPAKHQIELAKLKKKLDGNLSDAERKRVETYLENEITFYGQRLISIKKILKAVQRMDEAPSAKFFNLLYIKADHTILFSGKNYHLREFQKVAGNLVEILDKQGILILTCDDAGVAQVMELVDMLRALNIVFAVEIDDGC